MKNHSMIFDDFFDDPIKTKALIGAEVMSDVRHTDGVTYPNITILPKSVELDVIEKLTSLFGPITPKIMFARYSFETTKPPHWAHSDREIAQYLALVYLNKGHSDAGTACVRHKALDFETHPTEDLRRQTLIGHANKREEWEITYMCPAKFNRLFVLNTDLIHASMGEFGNSRDDGRLVISIFFDRNN